MVYITYAQENMKPVFDERIRRLFNLVKTRSTPDLWIKVFVYRDEIKYWKLFNRDIKQFKNYFGNRFDVDSVKKQMFYKSTRWRGHYRYAEVFGHGFYDKEWKFIRKHPKIKHVITLKIGESCKDLEIARLIAHEYRHYLQFRKYGCAMTRRGFNGRKSRPVQVERDAKKWEAKRISTLKQKGKL